MSSDTILGPETASESAPFDLNGVKFALGFPAHGAVPAETLISFVKTVHTFGQHGIQLDLIYELYNSLPTNARNSIADSFMRKSDADKLIWIDSDISWEAEDLLRLCCWSTKYPFVGAMYSTKREGAQKFLGAHYPDPTTGGPIYNEYGMIRMLGLGFGFMIVDRSVFETMKATTPMYNDRTHTDVYAFFQEQIINHRDVGEDMFFCREWCKTHGGEIWVDPDINLGHVGTKVYSGSLREALKVAFPIIDNCSDDQS